MIFSDFDMTFTSDNNATGNRNMRHLSSDGDKPETLAELRILIVEDEALVAMDLEYALNEAGAEVIGPAKSVEAGMRLLEEAEAIDGAILDVDLRGELVFPLADRLRDAGIPILFHTARADREQFDRDYPGSPVCVKPAQPRELIARAAETFG